MLRLLLPLCLALCLCAPAWAADLVIAVQADIAALDPHVAPAQTGEAVLRHVYDALVDRDPELHIVPSLATSWRVVDPVTWEFTLRPGVRFSDGTPLEAEDIGFSIRRAGAIRYAAGTYAPYVRAVKSVTVVAPDLVRVETVQPYPQLLGDLVRIGIVSAELAGQAGTEAFNRGAAAIGTGPYKVQSWAPGDRLVLVRNPNYWGKAQLWDQVTFRPVASDAARLAALLSGDAQLIDKVPLPDIARLRGNPDVTLTVHDGNRSMFLAPNFADPTGAYVTDDAGRHFPANPLLDPNVRQAVSLAINRAAIVDRVLGGLGSVANQVVPAAMFGWDPDLPAARTAPDEARRLLAEAGYPHGFHLVLHCSNGRYVNDQETCQAAAQMLSRVGIRTEVQAEAQSLFYARLGRGEFDLVLNGWGSDTGDSIIVLRQALHSVDPSKGLGGFNRGRIADPELDRLIETATSTLDDDLRRALQFAAMRRATDEGGLIPLYTASWVWGTRRGITYQGGFEEGTLAMRAAPAP